MMGRLRETGAGLGIILTCVAFVVLMAPIPAKVFVPTSSTGAPLADIPDPPNSAVLAANFTPSLVQGGTPSPFTGNGLAGIILRASGVGNELNWAIEGWANQTTGPTDPVCQRPGFHFTTADWYWVADSSQGGSRIYTTLPDLSFRMGPDGDQCPRTLAFGTWHVHLRIDHLGDGPRGIYDAPDGRHIDTWDRSIDADFQVPA